MALKIKRRLHLFHRWAGIGLCGFFALWFFSGMFMMYVEYPQLTRKERLQAAPDLDFQTAVLTPGKAVERLQPDDFTTSGTPRKNITLPPPTVPLDLASIRLSRILDRPAYVIAPEGSAQPRVVFADDGTVLPRVTKAQAMSAAGAFAPDGKPVYLGSIQSDQWSVSAALNAHRPLHHIALADGARTELYISSTTGEVVRDSTRRERILNYFAAVSHWLYPHVLRQFPEAWSWVVNVIAGFGCLFALSGLWVGVLRTRRKQPRVRSMNQRLIRRHFLTGAVFGVVLLTWVFSGWMSMNPGSLNPPRAPSANEKLVFTGSALRADDFTALPLLPSGAVEAELKHFMGTPYYAVTHRDGKQSHLPGKADSTAFPAEEIESQLRASAAALLPGATSTVEILSGYDNHYYTRHPEEATRPLPAMRVRFADKEKTWFHLNLATGEIIDRSTRVNRLFRHLYNGLHSLDWWWLWSRRPLWDIVVLLLSIGGLSLSLLGMVLGIRRLKPRAAAKAIRAA